MVTAEEAERLAAERPAAMRLLTLAEALDLKGLYPVRTLVCLRGPNERVVEEAAIHARGRDEHNVAVLYIDEVPGLFVPRDTEPTRDARDVLVTAAEWFQRHEITALPIWRIAQSAGDAIADVATELGIDAVFIGTSRRGTLWRMLRGSAITRLVAATPAQTRIVIVG
jgi:nucleotide-binding universal stress UspA family protein